MRGRERQTLGRPRASRDPYSVSYRWFAECGSRLGARFAGLAGTTVCLALAVFLATPIAAHADPIEDFYKNRQLRFIIGANAGGSYDSYARLAAQHLGRHIPGHPTIVAANMPGASGMQSAAYLYQLAPKDGSVLGIFNQSMAQRQVLEPDLIRFDAGKFNWLGAMATSTTVFVTWYTSGVRTLADARKRDVVLGALTNEGGNAVYPLLLNKFLGTRFKLVLGYQGGNTIELAMERGEVEGRGSVIWSGLKALWPQWVAQKKFNVLLQIGLRKEQDLPDVPLLVDLAKTPQEAAIFRFISSDTAMGFPVVAPAGVPAERVAALRKAFADMMRDPDFLRDARQRALPVELIPGEDVERVVASLIGTPPDVVALLKRSIAELKPGSKAAK
jgi:tripartite-type tricarboxylate transporter receptor subunit TctC